jgi:type III secretory pathway component EscS
MSSGGYDTKPAYDGVGNRGIDYMKSVSFSFSSPEYFKNLAIGAVCILSTLIIPVIGQLVWMGYVFDIVEALHRNPHERYPDFTFDKFVDYMLRGLWIFLVGLITAVLIVPIVVGIVVAGFVCAGLTAGEDAAPVFAIGAIAIFAVLIIAVSVVLNILMTPFFLRAGLTQDFGKSFDFGFAKDFLHSCKHVHGESRLTPLSTG